MPSSHGAKVIEACRLAVVTTAGLHLNISRLDASDDKD